MIDQISIRNAVNAKSGHAQVRVWIGGIPFSADLVSETMERTIHRIASAAGLDVLDTRKEAPDDSAA